MKFSRKLFDSCMQVIWNAVVYDPVADRLSAWRNRKMWSGRNIDNKLTGRLPELTEVIPVEDVSCIIGMFVYCFYFFYNFFLNYVFKIAA